MQLCEGYSQFLLCVQSKRSYVFYVIERHLVGWPRASRGCSTVLYIRVGRHTRRLRGYFRHAGRCNRRQAAELNRDIRNHVCSAFLQPKDRTVEDALRTGRRSRLRGSPKRKEVTRRQAGTRDPGLAWKVRGFYSRS